MDGLTAKLLQHLVVARNTHVRHLRYDFKLWNSGLPAAFSQWISDKDISSVKVGKQT